MARDSGLMDLVNLECCIYSCKLNVKASPFDLAQYHGINFHNPKAILFITSLFKLISFSSKPNPHALGRS
jgi:hypothetical protein